MADLKRTFDIQLTFNNQEDSWFDSERIYDAVLVEQQPFRGRSSRVIWAQGKFCFGSFLTFEKVNSKQVSKVQDKSKLNTSDKINCSTERTIVNESIDSSQYINYSSDFSDCSVDMRSV